MTSRAPKQWVLTKNETINTYESWKQNIQYVLSLDASFAPFLAEGSSWEKKTRNNNEERRKTNDERQRKKEERRHYMRTR